MNRRTFISNTLKAAAGAPLLGAVGVTAIVPKPQPRFEHRFQIIQVTFRHKNGVGECTISTENEDDMEQACIPFDLNPAWTSTEIVLRNKRTNDIYIYP